MHPILWGHTRGAPFLYSGVCRIVMLTARMIRSHIQERCSHLREIFATNCTMDYAASSHINKVIRIPSISYSWRGYCLIQHGIGYAARLFMG